VCWDIGAGPLPLPIESRRPLTTDLRNIRDLHKEKPPARSLGFSVQDLDGERHVERPDGSFHVPADCVIFAHRVQRFGVNPLALCISAH